MLEDDTTLSIRHQKAVAPSWAGPSWAEPSRDGPTGRAGPVTGPAATGRFRLTDPTLLALPPERCNTNCAVTGRDGTGRDGTGRDGTGRDGTGRDGRDGTGRDGMGWDGTGRDGMGRELWRRH